VWDEGRITVRKLEWTRTHGSEFNETYLAVCKVLAILNKFVAQHSFPSGSVCSWNKCHMYDAAAPEKTTLRFQSDGTLAGEVGDIPTVKTACARDMAECFLRLLYSYVFVSVGITLAEGLIACPFGLGQSRDKVELYAHANLVDDIARILRRFLDYNTAFPTSAMSRLLDATCGRFRSLMGPRSGNHSFSSACYHVAKYLEVMTTTVELSTVALRDATNIVHGGASSAKARGGAGRDNGAPAGKKHRTDGASASTAQLPRLLGGNPASTVLCQRSEAACPKYTGLCRFSHAQKPEPAGAPAPPSGAAPAPGP
jgi:hypothetical protein